MTDSLCSHVPHIGIVHDMQGGTDSMVFDSLDRMTPSSVACATWESIPPPEPVHPSEELLIRKAVLKRQSAFRAGRHAAHKALAGLGRDCDSILAGARREPLWPTGCIGSISHAIPVSVAVAAQQDVIRALGVDIESAQGLNEAEWDLVCTDSELAWLREHGDQAEQYAMLVFSAKETLFKMQYPHTGSFVDFREASVQLIEKDQVFEARLPEHVHEALRHPTPFLGRYCTVGELVLTAAWVENR